MNDVVDEPDLGEQSKSISRLWLAASTSPSPYLRLFNRGVLPVAHGAHVEALLPLAVTLLEELLHDERNPAPVDVQRLRGIAQVSTVHHVLKHLVARENPSIVQRPRSTRPLNIE